jgi:DNA-binding transcriptional LysR family regulator
MHKLARHATLRQLQVFEAIARLKSFTRAAEELFLTQSTVSTQVKNLTDLVGMPLVEYVNKQVRLTEAGSYLYRACQDVFRALDNVEVATANLRGLKIGTLSVSAITTAKYFVPEVLGAFAQANPDIDVSLHILNREKVIERLSNNEDDVYILGQDSPANLEIVSEDFAPNPLYVMASRDHPLVKAGRRLSLKELADQPLIMREPGSGIRAAVEKLFAAKGLRPKVNMVLSSNEAIKHALIGQLGISVLSLHTILLEGVHGPISVLDVEKFPIKRKWYVVRPKGKEPSFVTRGFLNFLHEEGKRLTQAVTEAAKTLKQPNSPQRRRK